MKSRLGTHQVTHGAGYPCLAQVNILYILFFFFFFFFIVTYIYCYYTVGIKNCKSGR